MRVSGNTALDTWEQTQQAIPGKDVLQAAWQQGWLPSGLLAVISIPCNLPAGYQIVPPMSARSDSACCCCCDCVAAGTSSACPWPAWCRRRAPSTCATMAALAVGQPGSHLLSTKGHDAAKCCRDTTTAGSCTVNASKLGCRLWWP